LADEFGLDDAKDLLDQTSTTRATPTKLLAKIATGGMLRSGIKPGFASCPTLRRSLELAAGESRSAVRGSARDEAVAGVAQKARVAIIRLRNSSSLRAQAVVDDFASRLAVLVP
jgi:hypothetical protein